MLTRFGHFGFCYASSLSSATRVAALTIALVTVSSSSARATPARTSRFASFRLRARGL